MSVSDQEQPTQPSALAAGSNARRNEDIALDLLKFVAGSTNILRNAAPSTGFTAAGAPKPEDQVTTLLDLYARCREAVTK